MAEATIHAASWPAIQALAGKLEAAALGAPTVAEAAQQFVTRFRAEFSTIVLARVFIVVRANRLPAVERTWANDFAASVGRTVGDTTPVLGLAGTSGTKPVWCDRATSSGHRAIPLVDKELVEGAPMIAELLASLKTELVGLSADAPAQLRPIAGGLNARFYVPDARSTVDARGRHVIAARDFVEQHDIRTVFGMGGTYVDGTLVAAIMFTREVLDVREVDRFPSMIGTFKLRTASLVGDGKLF